jgi:hypothetical protein
MGGVRCIIVGGIGIVSPPVPLPFAVPRVISVTTLVSRCAGVRTRAIEFTIQLCDQCTPKCK